MTGLISLLINNICSFVNWRMIHQETRFKYIDFTHIFNVYIHILLVMLPEGVHLKYSNWLFMRAFVPLSCWEGGWPYDVWRPFDAWPTTVTLLTLPYRPFSIAFIFLFWQSLAFPDMPWYVPATLLHESPCMWEHVCLRVGVRGGTAMLGGTQLETCSEHFNRLLQLSCLF